ncbi:hypothetical protein KN1_24740 [Stygiolobus caldivivus]|uniref:Uncharacterized protein n=2 Tax=Stygiolobus caldivivus TaxID=2824673 RepID=A0A8D5ZKE5_9CREN|nr:hypothetical protein KN1_24740 [Stygiolobus caldivivus]
MRIENMISLIFHPSVSTSLGFIVIYAVCCHDLLDLVITLTFFSFFPFLLTLILLKLGKVSDLLVTKREERGLLILLSFIGYLAAVLILYLTGVNLFLYISILYIINTLLIFLITLVYKISIHISVLSGVATTLTLLFGINFAFLYIVTVIVAWARVKAKEHTLSQVLSALILFSVLTFLEIKFFLGAFMV